MPKTLIFDIETHSSDLLYTLPPHEFVRLIGYKWLGKETVITTDLDELREQIRSAQWIIGHNIHAFDLPAVFGVDSDEPYWLAQEERVFDTWVHAVLVNPAPPVYTNRFGQKALADKPEQMRRWYSLDEQAYQLGVPGKTHDLKELAHEFGDPSLNKKARIADGFGKIPVDDERFVEYLRGDIEASEWVGRKLRGMGDGFNAYAKREQKIAAIASLISCNGLSVDTETAQHRVDSLSVRREDIMDDLEDRYGFPTEGKAPWATTDGKEAILKALADHGITPDNRDDWTRTKTGAPSMAGDVLIEMTKGSPAEGLGQALAELKGQRSLSQLALDSTHPDGKVHPEITMLQRSGRWSTTRPGLTIWTSRGEGAVEKTYFIPDSPDEVLLEIDYSNADARVVAALSGDRRYAERFEPGADGHMINAIAAWGEEEVAKDPSGYRQRAKVPGHGWGYRVGPNTLSRQTGMPVSECRTFLGNMNKTYGAVVRWQNRATTEGKKGFVRNEWGRKMVIEPGREYTQAPALLGQSGTREIVCDALLRMPVFLLRRVKAQIHDALLFSVPRDHWQWYRDQFLLYMETYFEPSRGGQLIHFPAEAGPPGLNWYEAAHA